MIMFYSFKVIKAHSLIYSFKSSQSFVKKTSTTTNIDTSTSTSTSISKHKIK